MSSSLRRDPDLLSELAEAVQLRSKALRHKFASVEVEPGCDEDCDPSMDKLSVTLREGISVNSTTLRFIFWQDRWVWVDARTGSTKGWHWSLTHQGRLRGGYTGREFLRCVEQFHQLLPTKTSPMDLESASRFWEKLLLKGPRSASG
jgi:hypothetical protein